jgi:hypothetical protein
MSKYIHFSDKYFRTEGVSLFSAPGFSKTRLIIALCLQISELQQVHWSHTAVTRWPLEAILV